MFTIIRFILISLLCTTAVVCPAQGNAGKILGKPNEKPPPPKKPEPNTTKPGEKQPTGSSQTAEDEEKIKNAKIILEQKVLEAKKTINRLAPKFTFTPKSIDEAESEEKFVHELSDKLHYDFDRKGMSFQYYIKPIIYGAFLDFDSMYIYDKNKVDVTRHDRLMLNFGNGFSKEVRLKIDASPTKYYEINNAVVIEKASPIDVMDCEDTFRLISSNFGAFSVTLSGNGNSLFIESLPADCITAIRETLEMYEAIRILYNAREPISNYYIF
ncbi:MAG: hypothetical protein FWG02_07245 [Holophagaceae bacterium]|nr:hypothetical protein [Holophagaceae bacterium]